MLKSTAKLKIKSGKFPKLMMHISKKEELVILATGSSTNGCYQGVVLRVENPTDQFQIGSFRVDFNGPSYVDFIGEITLSTEGGIEPDRRC